MVKWNILLTARIALEKRDGLQTSYGHLQDVEEFAL